MDADAGYVRLCRLGLLCGAILNWFAAAALLWPASGAAWHYSPRVLSRLAAVVVHMSRSLFAG